MANSVQLVKILLPVLIDSLTHFWFFL